MSLSVSSLWSLIEGGISTPKGFLASGIKAGLKASNKFDLALLLAPEGSICAGTFTQSLTKAACIDLSRERLDKSGGKVRAVLINSGQANAYTGDRGFIDSKRASKALADLLFIDAEKILICSTGVIGVPIQMGTLLKGLGPLVQALSSKGGNNAAQAILTTDLVQKQIAIQAKLDGKVVHIGGMAKGSGMIHPNMSTMLGYLTCDTSVPSDVWQAMVKRVVNRSFNAITVDGDTSTNDSFLAFAAGEPLHQQFWDQLEEGLLVVAEHLAKAIARDGEGATCLVEVQVEGAENNGDAIRLARTICGSSLVKTAIRGSDPNWGRIIAAVGYADVEFTPEYLSLWLGPYQLIRKGEPLKFDRLQITNFINERKEGAYLLDDIVQIRLMIGRGSGFGRAWGCDLSEGYVRINADYTT